MGGIAGQYFKQFGLVVAFAVFFSLLVARLITPLLAAYFMRSKPHADKEGWMLRAYTWLVRWSVAHHYKTVGLGLAIFAASVGSFYLLPSGFLPADDTARTLLAVELPPGSRIDETKAVTAAIARQIGARSDVKSVFVNGGKVMGGGAEVRKATLVINLVPRDDAQAEPGPDQGGDQPKAWPRCPTSASGSCRTTASARSRWWCRGATPQP